MNKKNQTVKELLRLTLNAHLVAFYLHLYPDKSVKEASEAVNGYMSRRNENDMKQQGFRIASQ
jgi:hypothetical protein